MKRVAITCALLSFATAAHPQTSKEFALMARKSWAAFECAALAAQAQDQTEHERLFKIGYEMGKRAIEAALADKISKDDAMSSMPWGFTMAMAGPSPDFMLGAIWRDAYRNSETDVSRDMFSKPIDTSLWKTNAQTKFQKTNCALIQ
ncbi:hypothetical protein HWX16_20920 [Ochrobactrum intermedium]|uniref:hypothetical protein n=1 Tax=Brucella intermedia TaxID=94625 RepID=UPI00159CC012|nr:hypothetical protein [Brucella intermedia]NVM42779.1 hypothetical protein [Brucella intermedia]UXO85492.1 hypothetical protein N8I72_14050 [Brucella intermedia]